MKLVNLCGYQCRQWQTETSVTSSIDQEAKELDKNVRLANQRLKFNDIM